jgi:hypothetical protein
VRELRLLIWNDDASIAEQWAAAATRDGFHCVEWLSTMEIHDIEATYARYRPDVMVLDLVHDRTERPIGLTIATALQRLDPLAPLILLTQRPADAYERDGHLRWQGFAGVFPRDLVNVRGQFRDVIVGESLLLKHLLQPEYCLARECALSLAAYQNWGAYVAVAHDLREAINRLPAAGSTDSWHPLLCGAVRDALKSRGWMDVADRYWDAVTVFERSDQFYMAGTKSRRHLSHNVQVCLLGLALLLADSPVRQVALSGGGHLIDAALVWCCIGTVHDAAYLSEHMTNVSSQLADLAAKFAPLVSGPKLEAWDWPQDHHSIVGSRMWECGALPHEQRAACLLIGAGIAGHDAKFSKAPAIAIDNWPVFLAVLCDELQDWQRERPGAVPGIPTTDDGWRYSQWRLVEPSRIGIERDERGHYRISLDFMVVDHTRSIHETSGLPGLSRVGERFDQILHTLTTYLRSRIPIQVQLSATFTTRQVQPIVREATLPSV